MLVVLQVLNSQLNTRVKFCGLLLVLGLFILNTGFLAGPSDIDYKEIPVLKMNFYLMGMDEVDEKITIRIGDNVSYLNEEFEGEIEFEIDQLFLESNGAYLPDIHSEVIKGKSHEIEQMLRPLETKGTINVFIFPTYRIEGSTQALTGFTPIMSRYQYNYVQQSPTFDRIYLSYSGLESQSTIVHEMGHFLGLKHPWEMSIQEKWKLGFNRDNESSNHMSYDVQVSSFTFEQLSLMRKNVFRYRSYLVKKKKWVLNQS